jgi:hypothetical protein
VLLLRPALPGLGNRIRFPDLLTRIVQERRRTRISITGGSRSRSRRRRRRRCGGGRRWQRIEARKAHIHWIIEEVKPLTWVWVHRHHGASFERTRINQIKCSSFCVFALCFRLLLLWLV